MVFSIQHVSVVVRLLQKNTIKNKIKNNNKINPPETVLGKYKINFPDNTFHPSKA